MTELRLTYVGCGLSGRSESIRQVHRRVPRASALVTHAVGENASHDGGPFWIEFSVEDRVRLQVRGRYGSVPCGALDDELASQAHVVVVVIDSQRERFEANQELLEFLARHRPRPMVLQFNKRDLPNAMPLDELQRGLNPHRFPAFESVAPRGMGTMEAFHAAAILAAKLAGCSDELRALLATAPSPKH